MKRDLLVLAAIVALASILRVWGLDYGLPHPLSRPDEERIVGRAQTIFATGDWHPGSFFYPSLLFYVDTGALWAYYAVNKGLGHYDRPFDLLFDIAVTRPGLHYLIARWVGAIAGIATVVATYFLGVSSYGSRAVGLVAALFLAVCHLHVRESHFATVDVVMTLLVTASLVHAVRASERANTASFVLAGLFAGLAISTKYNAGLVVVGIVAAGWCIRSRLGTKGVAIRLAVSALVAGVAFLATSPYVLLRFQGFLANMDRLGSFLYEPEAGLALWDHLTTTLPYGLGWPVFLVSAAGVVRALYLRRPADIVLLAFVIPFFAVASSVRITFPRYVVPIVPALVVLGAELVHAAASRYRPLVLGTAAAVLVAPALVSSVGYDQIASNEDTRVLAERWVSENLAPQTSIVVCSGYGAPDINRDRRRPPAFAVVESDCATDAAGGDYVITHEHRQLTRFSKVSDPMSEWLEVESELVVVFDPYRATNPGEPVFYRADAFYIPFAGFGAVERGGPIVKIWRSRRIP